MTHEGNHYSRRKLLQYLNIDLLIDDLRTIEDHVEKCTSCKQLIKELEPLSNKSERDKFFENTTETIRIRQNRNSTSSRKARPIYNAVLLVFILCEIVAIFSFDIFSFPNLKIKSALEEAKAQIFNVSQLNENAILIDSTLMMTSNFYVNDVPDSISDEMDTLDDKNEIIISLQSNELTNQNSNNKVLSNTIENVDEVVSKPIPKKQKVIATSNIDSEEIPLRDSETIPLENKEEEVVIVKKNGTIEVIANSKSQAFPEGGFPSLNQYIKNGYKYPDEAISKDLQGEVVVQFTLTADSNITDLKIISSLSVECDNLAKNIIKNGPKWQSFVGDDFVVYRSATLKFTFKL